MIPALWNGLTQNRQEGNDLGRLGERSDMAAAICSGQRGQTETMSVENTLAGMAR